MAFATACKSGLDDLGRGEPLRVPDDPKDLTNSGGSTGETPAATSTQSPPDAGPPPTAPVVPSAVDMCLDDLSKTSPGVCGCGVTEDTTDTDLDGTWDCVDACPSDPAKTTPGSCGCSSPDSMSYQDTLLCTGISTALVHRYRFDASGTTITDAVGNAHGTLRNTVLADTGTASLSGGTSNEFVDLPNALISTLTDVSLEVWMTWHGDDSQPWQRIFDFGASSAAEGSQQSGVSYLALSPQGSAGSNFLLLRFRGGGEQLDAQTAAPLMSDVLKHLVAVFDDTNDTMRVYVDGAQAATAGNTHHLSDINDINNWLGRSQYSGDPELNAELHEFRIYGRALSATEIQYNAGVGPDPAFL